MKTKGLSYPTCRKRNLKRDLNTNSRKTTSEYFIWGLGQARHTGPTPFRTVFTVCLLVHTMNLNPTNSCLTTWTKVEQERQSFENAEENKTTAPNNVHIQFGGFGALIKFQFHYYLWSRGTDFSLVALSAYRP